MRSVPLRIFMWILGFSALLGNVTVIVWRFREKEKNTIQSFLILNLAISDCLMGVYMIIIASADAHFRDVYIYKASQWLGSLMCSLAGILAVVSSEVSVFILTVISLDRFLCIVFPFGRVRLSQKGSRVIIACGWTCGILLAVLPVMNISYFGDAYYGHSSVCLAIPLDDNRSEGWEFSITVFLGLNFACLLAIAGCYIAIIIVSKRSSRSIRSSKTLANDIRLASKTAMIVTTDMFCWLPIVILGTLGTTGAINIPSVVYAWTAVFILPINSSINPYLYTFSSMRRAKPKKVSGSGTYYETYRMPCDCNSAKSTESPKISRKWMQGTPGVSSSSVSTGR
ncbi:hypothetical protein HOLleu_05862 [Holothuria leucospilota]|uniref:G-protein coupled receptors family 1 profile domain-containing protein n=1 Tax=Holothuria leucospilota TaxID=206669 RepID=A0A9Q1HJ76_HOLLE|nr:hypothetical protein HOLleu_05862 [Holothuria leucospilota]